MTTKRKKRSGTDPPAGVGDAQDPTFVEICGARRGNAAPAPPPSTSSAYSAYNPLAVERYEHSSFVDVTLEPVAASRRRPPVPPETHPASLSRGIHRAVQLQHWKQRFDAVLAGRGGRRLRRGFAGGAAIATLMGGLLLGPGSQANVSAQEPTPPPPPFKQPPPDSPVWELIKQYGDYRPLQGAEGKEKPRSKPTFVEVEPTDPRAVEALVARIGEDSPLWQIVEPGDGSPLWRLIARIGADSPLWDRLAALAEDRPVWERLEEIGADNALWDRLAPDGDASRLLERVERAGGGEEDVGKPTFSEVGKDRDPLWVSPSDVLPFEERFGPDNPLRDPLDVGDRNKPALADIDGDGDLDAFFGSKYYGICYFENTGGDENPVFVQRYGYDNPLYDVWDYGTAPTFVDIDGDGDLDAFVGWGYYYGYYSYGGVRFFRNYSQEYYGDDHHPIFHEQFGPFDPYTGEGNPLYDTDEPYSVPAFVDVDGDGDFDAFVGWGKCYLWYCDGGVNFYENLAESYSGQPVFQQRYGPYNPLNYTYAYYAAPTFADIDGDGDFDAFVGQKYGYYLPGGVRFFRNFSQELYADDEHPVFAEGFGPFNPLDELYAEWAAPDLADTDGDGDFDAFIGLENGTVAYYENTGDPYGPVFTRRAGPAYPFGGVGGRWDRPTLVDFDGDGDLDAFVGHAGSGMTVVPPPKLTKPSALPIPPIPIYYGGYYYDAVRYFENIGDDRHPRFTERMGEDNPLGERYPYWWYTRVTAPASGDTTSENGPLGGGSYLRWWHTSYTAPTFVDVDGDGDLDAFVGHSGRGFYCGYYDGYDGYDKSAPNAYYYCYYDSVRFFENYENYAGEPFFVERAGPYGNPLYVANGYYMHFTAPTFVDIDEDGDMDAFVGHEGYDEKIKVGSGPANGYGYHSVRFFQNFSQEYYGDDQHPVFFEGTGPFNPLSVADGYYVENTTPAFVDVDGDGDFDAFVGHAAGWYAWWYGYDYVRCFENTGDAHHPIFEEREGYYNPLYEMYYAYYTAPTFADVNGDGFVDGFVGTGGYGKIKAGSDAAAEPKKIFDLDTIRYFERIPRKVYMPLVIKD
jgi:hypothetical protein